MRGYQREPDEDAAIVGTLKPWEALVADAVGNVIEFWNFKRSHGLVWALLYLRGRPLDAGQIQAELGLSKGGVSMGIRELEHWNIVRRVRAPGDAVWRYAAETDFLGMIGKVVAEREGALVDSVARDLSRAELLASDDTPDADALERVRKMRTLADLVSAALRAFLHTASLDIQVVRHTLAAVAAQANARAPSRVAATSEAATPTATKARTPKAGAPSPKARTAAVTAAPAKSARGKPAAKSKEKGDGDSARGRPRAATPRKSAARPRAR